MADCILSLFTGFFLFLSLKNIPLFFNPYQNRRRAMICAKLNQTSKAIHLLKQSISLYPYNWSAWLDLAKHITNIEQVKCDSMKKKSLKIKSISVIKMQTLTSFQHIFRIW